MSTARFGRGQKAMALIPLALLSAAWTASLAGSRREHGVWPTRPPSPRLPRTALVRPHPGHQGAGQRLVRRHRRPGCERLDAEQVVANSSTSGIPAAALAAYQRAATGSTPPTRSANWAGSCWPRSAGSSPTTAGATATRWTARASARPASTARARRRRRHHPVVDTDAGRYDATATWTGRSARCSSSRRPGRSCGVDADGDGQRTRRTSTTPRSRPPSTSAPARRPQDTAGQRAAVFRYNHSQSYVDLVLSIMNAYLDGEYTSVPNGTTSAGYPSRGPRRRATP